MQWIINNQYTLFLDGQLAIERIEDQGKELFSKAKPCNIDDILNKHQIKQEFERKKRTYEFLNYYRLPISFESPGSLKALARCAFFSTFVLLIAVLQVPELSNFICIYLLPVMLAIAFLSVASVQCYETVIKIGYDN